MKISPESPQFRQMEAAEYLQKEVATLEIRHE